MPGHASVPVGPSVMSGVARSCRLPGTGSPMMAPQPSMMVPSDMQQRLAELERSLHELRRQVDWQQASMGQQVSHLTQALERLDPGARRRNLDETMPPGVRESPMAERRRLTTEEQAVDVRALTAVATAQASQVAQGELCEVVRTALGELERLARLASEAISMERVRALREQRAQPSRSASCGGPCGAARGRTVWDGTLHSTASAGSVHSGATSPIYPQAVDTVSELDRALDARRKAIEKAGSRLLSDDAKAEAVCERPDHYMECIADRLSSGTTASSATRPEQELVPEMPEVSTLSADVKITDGPDCASGT